jgi:methylmalonyl-CoA mutase
MKLAGLFPAATEADWRAAVERVLKGADFDRTLVGRTADGIAIRPLQPRRADATPIAGARGANPWKIVARLDDPDAARGNLLAVEDLMGGADSLVLAFGGAPASHGFGLREPAPSIFDAALAEIHPDLIHIRLESAPFGGRAVAEGFAAFARRRRLPGATLDVDFGLSPLSDFAAVGHMPLTFGLAMRNVAEIARHLGEDGFSGAYLRADGRVFHAAGASEAQELASVIAQAVAYLRGLGAEGIAPAEVAARLSFTLAADDDFFLTIAKCRALRLLWARIEAASGIPAAPLRLHVETAWRMLARRDPYVNLLRSTIAAFAAGVGGADSIEVRPFTAALGLPDSAARRLARNTSLILVEETNLHRAIDPAAGAGGIEALTDALCEKAWGLFQLIEGQSHVTEIGHATETGMAAALGNGFLAEMIRDTRDGRAREIATRRTPLTGVSEFPNLTEAPVEVLEPLPGRPQAKGKNSGESDGEGAFPARRLAEPYEVLRDRAEAMVPKPAVFLATLGRPADFTARASFTKNAFEAGGIAAISNAGFAEGEGTDLVALTEAFKASGAMLACITGTDAAYQEDAADAAMALMASGAKAIYLAGKPGDLEPSLRAAGVEAFLFARCDILAFLDAALARCEGE